MTAWRDVEVAAAEALDGPTEEDLEAIRAATFTVEAVKEREAVTDHDVAAFVDVLARVGRAGRPLDPLRADVVGRARHRAGAAAPAGGAVIVPGARELAAALAERAREHADTLCVGRTHGVHAEPTSFGLKLAGLRDGGRAQRRPARARVRPGGDRGDLRRGRHLRDARPRLRARGCSTGWGCAPSRSPPRSCRAIATPSC